METLFGTNPLANFGALAGLVIVIGYVGKITIEWFRGNKSIETEWRSVAIRDAIAGHEILKGLFDSLKEQVDTLEADLKESKRREAALISSHHREVVALRKQYLEKIRELEAQIAELKALEVQIEELRSRLRLYETGPEEA